MIICLFLPVILYTPYILFFMWFLLIRFIHFSLFSFFKFSPAFILLLPNHFYLLFLFLSRLSFLAFWASLCSHSIYQLFFDICYILSICPICLRIFFAAITYLFFCNLDIHHHKYNIFGFCELFLDKNMSASNDEQVSHSIVTRCVCVRTQPMGSPWNVAWCVQLAYKAKYAPTAYVR